MSEPDLSDFKEAFDLHDETGAGVIKTAQLGPVLRALGQIVNEDSMEEMCKAADPHNTGEISFENFIMLNARIFEDKCSDEDFMVIQAFETFDKQGTGYVSVEDCKHILGTIAGMSGKDVADFISAADKKKTGKVDYKVVVRKFGDQDDDLWFNGEDQSSQRAKRL